MTHLCIAIIIPSDVTDIMDFIERQMGPYDASNNPAGTWEGYAIGGVWDGWIKDLDTGHQRIEDNTAMTQEAIDGQKWPHAIITPDGCWHDDWCLGWGPCVTTSVSEQENRAREILGRNPGCRVVVVDALACGL